MEVGWEVMKGAHEERDCQVSLYSSQVFALFGVYSRHHTPVDLAK